MIPATIVVGVVDAGFIVCLLAIWCDLCRRGVNRPGQIALALLGAARLGELVERWPNGLVPASPANWLLWTAFSFVFLYTIYQLGRFIEVARYCAAAYRPQRQALKVLQFASRPGRPRRTDL